MSINAWVDQGDEINGNGNFFADTMVEIDASANTLLAGITVFSGGEELGNSGAAGLPPAYAEKYESGSWTSKPLLFNEQGTSNLDDPAGDGGAISEDGNIIVVGEPAFDNSSNSNNAEGRISLFRYDSTSGSYKGLNGTDASGTVILAPTEGANQKFGNRVAFSRDTSGVSPNPIVPSVLVVGEPNDEGDNTKNGGKIYTYQWGTTSANAYSLISGLTLSGTSGDAATREEFGNYPIKLNDAGTRIIIGAENGTNSKGQAIVYGRADLTTTTWTQVGAKIAAPNSDYHQFGKGVAIDGSGDIIAISDPKYGGGGASGVGASAPGQVLIYEYNASTWVQKGPAITGNYYTSTDTGDKEGRNIGISRDGNYVFSTANHAFGGKLNYPIDTSGAGLDASLNYNVDVAGGKFRLWEESQVNLNAFLGNTLYFYQVDATNSGHPLVIGTGADSNTLGEGRDVSYNNSGGSGTVIFKPSTAGTYYYYCSNHSGMGSLITILDPAGRWRH